MTNTWKFLALLTIPEVSQIDPSTGNYEYPALLITRRGAAMSYEIGAYRTTVKLHAHGTSTIRHFDEVVARQFRSAQHHTSATADVHARLLRDFVDNRNELKRHAAEQDVEKMREASRTQNYSHRGGSNRAQRG